MAGSAPDLGAVEGAWGWVPGLRQRRERGRPNSLACGMGGRYPRHGGADAVCHPGMAPSPPAVLDCNATLLLPPLANSILPGRGCDGMPEFSKCQASCQNNLLGAPSNGGRWYPSGAAIAWVTRTRLASAPVCLPGGRAERDCPTICGCVISTGSEAGRFCMRCHQSTTRALVRRRSQGALVATSTWPTKSAVRGVCAAGWVCPCASAHSHAVAGLHMHRVFEPATPHALRNRLRSTIGLQSVGALPLLHSRQEAHVHSVRQTWGVSAGSAVGN